MSERKKILIIDDERDLCLLLKDYFIKRNFDVFISHSLTEGQNIMHSISPDILFLDNNLPDGMSWNKAGQFSELIPGMHIVLTSAYHTNPPEMPIGCNYKIIEKPISFADLDAEFIMELMQH